MLILALILLSFIFYYSFKKKEESILKEPNLKNLVFYRDFLFLTMLPYFYYYNDKKYKEHYVLRWLSSDAYFLYAAVAATIFIFFFFLSYAILLPIFKKSIGKITANVSYKRLLTIASAFGFISFFIVLFLSNYLNTGIFAFINGMSNQEMNVTRNILSQGGGLLALNKIFIKAWIPMLSYLLFYLYLTVNHIFKRWNKLGLIFSFSSGLLASVFFLEKAVLFFYILGFLGVYVYTGKRLKKHYLPVAFIFSIFFISIMYIMTYGEKIIDIQYLKEIIIHRTATQSIGSVMSFYHYSENDYKGMAGISNLWAEIFGESFSSPYSDIIKYYVPETADTSGSMSSFVTGEAYGLFGVFGVVFSGVIVAAFLSFFEATKHSKALSIIFVGIYGLYFSHHYIASSFFSFIWPVGLVYNILPFLILLLLSLKSPTKYIS